MTFLFQLKFILFILQFHEFQSTLKEIQKCAQIITLPKTQFWQYYNNIKKMDPMCKECHQFFGVATQENLCSLCFKNRLKKNSIDVQIKKLQVQQPSPVKQADHSKCFKCHKKIGLLGIMCKKCDCSYCNSHRLPEDHECHVDFVGMGKKQIQKKNQAVIARKVEQI